MKLLQITAHLGGGVGKAILGVTLHPNNIYNTSIIVLEEPEKKQIVEQARINGAQIYICPTTDVVEALMTDADLVVLNWWNHPIMGRFLYQLPQVKTRLIIWNHINGCTYPYLPYEFLQQCDHIFFTSRYSYQNQLWTSEQREYIEEHSTIVLGNGDFFPEKMKHKTNYSLEESCHIGYAGTLNYSKIHPNYVQYCEQALKKNKNIQFVLAGDMDAELQKDIEKSTIKDCVKELGYVENMEAYYLALDVLGYLLNEDNYGTTENVILEAMACGIPVIAMAGGVENSIIDNKENGFLVNDPNEYASVIEQLIDHEELRKDVGEAGRKKACRVFGSEENIKRMLSACEELMKREKKVHSFRKVMGEKPVDWFLCFAGEDRKIFEQCKNKKISLIKDCKPIYKGERKSSIRHFLNYYPEDDTLRYLADMIREV